MKAIKNRFELSFSLTFSMAKMYIFLLFIFLVFRLFFISYFGDSELLLTQGTEILRALFWGVRYDTLVISYFLAPIFLLNIFITLMGSVSISNFFSFFIRWYFFICSLIVIGVLSVDIGFYSYFQDHINILIYGVIEDDTLALLTTVWKNYPVIKLLVPFLIFIVVAFKYPKFAFPKLINGKKYKKYKISKLAGLNLISFVLIVGGLRGGYSELVIAPKYIQVSSDEFLSQAALNGFIALENAVKLRKSRTSANFNVAKSMGYEKGIHEAFSDYLGLDTSFTKTKDLLELITRRTGKNLVVKESRPNVVVLVMESFGSSWLKYNTPEFNFLGDLQDHFKQDQYFRNIISADNGTIGSLMSIVTNIPTRPGTRYLSESRYLQLPLQSSANRPYASAGYKTNFFYGGKLGWRDIGKYFRFQGFDNVRGESAIITQLNLTKDIGNEWGVYDEHFFDAILKQLDESKRPQFIMGLSTTNHPPFDVPKGYKSPSFKLSPELENKVRREKDIFIKRFKAFEYSNQMLARFLSQLKKSSKGNNTIVVVTGDHNFWGFINYQKNEMYEKYLVPLYIYVPEKFLPKTINLDKIGSHEDIMTSIYNISLSEERYLSFGENLFDSAASYAINPKIYAGEEGVVYNKKHYFWDKVPLVNTAEKNSESFENLTKHYRSTLTVADYYLRIEYYKKKNEKKD